MRYSGFSHSEGTKLKISLSKKGKSFSSEHRSNLSKSLKGKKRPWVKPPQNRDKAIANLPRGKKHWAWKGGVTDLARKDRNSINYKAWRLAVFARDNFTCQKCYARGVYLHAHHIKPFAEHIELRFIVSNGITLCRKCHSLEPKHSHVYTQEQRFKIGSANRGRKISDSHKEILRLANLGRKPWNKGNRKRVQINCAFCLNLFQPLKCSSAFCSKSCAMKYRNKFYSKTTL